jgi:hypothetical protein
LSIQFSPQVDAFFFQSSPPCNASTWHVHPRSNPQLNMRLHITRRSLQAMLPISAASTLVELSDPLSCSEVQSSFEKANFLMNFQ